MIQFLAQNIRKSPFLSQNFGLWGQNCYKTSNKVNFKVEMLKWFNF